MAITTRTPGGTVLAGDMVRMSHYCWLAGQYGITTWTINVIATTPGTKLGDLAYGHAIYLATNLAPLVTSEARLLGVRAVRVTPNHGAAAGSATGDTVGTSGATPLPTQATGVLSWQTAFAGPANRGRVYLPFPSTDDIDGVTSLPDLGYLGLAQILATSWGVTHTTSVSQDGVRTTTFDTIVANALGTAFAIITSGVARPYWATQKRRGDLGRTNPPFIPF